jgi:hypothetical protein
VREGPAPQEARKISSKCSTRAETHGEGLVGMGKSGVMKKDQHEQSEPLLYKTRIMYLM